jgi:DNA primase catalytic core
MVLQTVDATTVNATEKYASVAPIPNNTGGASTNWIDADQVTALKESVDLVSVIESYNIPLFKRTSSSRATCLCPFHEDRNPSLSIDGKRGIFKCFACGAGGDVFRFVSLYETQVRREEMSFGQAIRKVAAEYGGDQFLSSLGGSVTGGTVAKETEVLKRKKERILLANAAAAAFYFQCLTEPYAGGARLYMRSRNVLPATVRSFSLGYAPDVYYGGGKREYWGKGGLVDHLQGLEFTPDEIIEAGLAKVRKDFHSQKSDIADDSQTPSANYTDLIDRFRGRIIVPIMDTGGRNVLGFGGRELPQSNSALRSAFQVPKYLNSPESLVFKKSTILFGLHKVNEQTLTGTSSVTYSSVIIVEGYMDAIALQAAGITGAVASMGAALSKEQLALAAKSAHKLNGKVFLCLDNDEAGLAAMERVCTNGMLKDVCNKHNVQYLVARLPDKWKDPAEYIDSLRSCMESEEMVAEFQRVVLKEAKDWTDFYVDTILTTYNSSALRGQSGSLGYIFDRAAEFIADSMGAADRTRTAYDFSRQLAKIMATESNETTVSSIVQSQLETDLIDAVTRNVDFKEATLRRAETVAGRENTSIQTVLPSFSRGSMSLVDEEDMLSRRARTKLLQPALSNMSASNVPETQIGKESFRQKGAKRERQQSRRSFKVRKERVETTAMVTKSPLMPHFDGFQFENSQDAAWLDFPEVNRQKVSTSRLGSLLLGSSTKSRVYGPFTPLTDESSGRPGRYRLNKPVFFNSNDYHGQKFLTTEASDAGYTDSPHQGRDIDVALIRDKIGFAPLVRQDVNLLARSTEDGLLTMLIRRRVARTAMRNLLSARSTVGVINDDLHWSCRDKQWLFNVLCSDIQEASDSPSELLTYLTRLPECPPSAFGIQFGVPGDQEDTVSNRSPPAVTANKIEVSTPFLGTQTRLSKSQSEGIDFERANEKDTAPLPGISRPKNEDVGSSALTEDSEPTAQRDNLEIDLQGLSFKESDYDTISSAVDILTGDEGNTHSCYDGFVDKSTFVTQHQGGNSAVHSLSRQSAIGTLDHLFITALSEDEGNLEDDIIQDSSQCELAVQRLFTTLHWAEASQRATTIRNQIQAATFRYEYTDEPTTNSMSRTTLRGNSSVQLVEELVHVTKKILSLSDSMSRLSTTVLYSSNDDVAEGKLNIALETKLTADLDEYCSSLQFTGQQSDSFFDMDQAEEDTVADTFDRIEYEYGSYCDDDFAWTSEAIDESRAPESNTEDLEDDEYDYEEANIEEELERIDLEWTDWVE